MRTQKTIGKKCSAKKKEEEAQTAVAIRNKLGAVAKKNVKNK